MREEHNPEHHDAPPLGPAASDTPYLSRGDVWSCVALFFLTTALFGRAVTFGFVSFDDFLYASDQGHVLSGLSLENVRWAFTTLDGGNWHPVTWLSLMLDAQLFGTSPAVFHAPNVIFHSLSTCLFFLLVRRFGAALWPSLLAAAVFAWHPLRVESVVWISERKDTLCVLFLFVCFHAHMSFARSRSKVAYATMLGFLILALGSKAMAVTAPAVMLMMDCWPLNNWTRGRWKRSLAGQVVPLIICIAFCVITLIGQKGTSSVTSLVGTPTELRLANSVNGYFIYLQQLLIPLNLGMMYPHPQFVGSAPLAASIIVPKYVGLCVVTGLLICVRKASPHLLFGWLFYLGTLVPVIGFVQVGFQAHADRYTYLPHAGLCLALALELSRSDGWFRRVVGPMLRIAVVVWLVWWTYLCHQQIGIWKDNQTLLSHTVKVTPNSFTAKALLASERSRNDRLAEADQLSADAVALNPTDSYVWMVRSAVLDKLGERRRALKAAEWAVQTRPDFPDAWVQYGLMVKLVGRIDLAIDALENALRLRPDDAYAYSLLASLLAETGEFDRAVPLWKRSIEIRPDIGLFQYGLGLALVMHSDAKAGIDYLKQATMLSPDSADAPLKLAWTLATISDPTLRDGPASLEYARLAVSRSKKPTAELLDTLAAALARNAMYAEAIETTDEAIRLANADGQTSFAARISARLSLYKAALPFPPPARPTTSSTQRVSDVE